MIKLKLKSKCEGQSHGMIFTAFIWWHLTELTKQWKSCLVKWDLLVRSISKESCLYFFNLKLACILQNSVHAWNLGTMIYCLCNWYCLRFYIYINVRYLEQKRFFLIIMTLKLIISLVKTITVMNIVSRNSILTLSKIKMYIFHNYSSFWISFVWPFY